METDSSQLSAQSPETPPNSDSIKSPPLSPQPSDKENETKPKKPSKKWKLLIIGMAVTFLFVLFTPIPRYHAYVTCPLCTEDACPDVKCGNNIIEWRPSIIMSILSISRLEQKPKLSIPTPIPNITDTVDLSSWKTLKNNQFNFTLQHPPDFTTDQLYISLFHLSFEEGGHSSPNEFMGSTSIVKNDNNYTLEEYVNQEICDGKNITNESPDRAKDVYKWCASTFQESKKETKINGIPGLTGSYNPYEHRVHISLFEKNGYIYKTSLSGMETGSDPQKFAVETMDKIINSMSLGQTSKPISGWKEYKNDQFQLSFYYRPDILIEESATLTDNQDKTQNIFIKSEEYEDKSDHLDYIKEICYSDDSCQKEIQNKIKQEKINNIIIHTFNFKDKKYAIINRGKKLISISASSEINLNQILSTFKFTETSAPTPTTTQWYKIDIHKKSEDNYPELVDWAYIRAPLAKLLEFAEPGIEYPTEYFDEAEKIITLVGDTRSIRIGTTDFEGTYYFETSIHNLSTSKEYEDEYLSAMLQKVDDSDLINYLTNNDYCQSDADCTIRSGGNCGYGSFNFYEKVADFTHGCTFSIDKETGTPIYEYGCKDFSYESAYCSKNTCLARGRSCDK